MRAAINLKASFFDGLGEALSHVPWAAVLPLLGVLAGGLISFHATAFEVRTNAVRESEAAERRVQRELLERRRDAVLELVNSMLFVGERSGPENKDELTAGGSRRLNSALSVLVLHLSASEQNVALWVRRFSGYTLSIHEAGARRIAVELGAQMLIDWHRGVISNIELVPFQLVSVPGNSVKVLTADWVAAEFGLVPRTTLEELRAEGATIDTGDTVVTL